MKNRIWHLTFVAIFILSTPKSLAEIGTCVSPYDLQLMHPPEGTEVQIVNPMAPSGFTPELRVWRAQCLDGSSIVLVNAIQMADTDTLFNGLAKVKQGALEYPSSFLKLFRNPESGSPSTTLHRASENFALLPGSYQQQQSSGWTLPIFDPFNYSEDFALLNLFSNFDLQIPSLSDGPTVSPRLNESMSGHFYAPESAGHGFDIHFYGDAIFLLWYTYDESGEAVWLTGDGGISGMTANTELVARRGMIFGVFNPDDIQEEIWGSLQIEFSSCSEASITYDAGERGSGQLEITRLLPLQPDCTIFAP